MWPYVSLLQEKNDADQSTELCCTVMGAQSEKGTGLGKGHLPNHIKSDRSWTHEPIEHVTQLYCCVEASPSLCCCWRWSISAWLLSAPFCSCRNCWKDPSGAAERKHTVSVWAEDNKQTQVRRVAERGKQAADLMHLIVFCPFKVYISVLMLWLSPCFGTDR